MTWDSRFRAFLATQTPHGVTRQLAPAGRIRGRSAPPWRGPDPVLLR